jgi:hypothetical protein
MDFHNCTSPQVLDAIQPEFTVRTRLLLDLRKSVQKTMLLAGDPRAA